MNQVKFYLQSEKYLTPNRFKTANDAFTVAMSYKQAVIDKENGEEFELFLGQEPKRETLDRIIAIGAETIYHMTIESQIELNDKAIIEDVDMKVEELLKIYNEGLEKIK